MATATRTRWHVLLAGAFSVAALCVTLWRFERGIDFTDEAFYLALPLRFALGDRPFVDELNVGQTAGILLYPFVKLHLALRGTTGIFQSVRWLYALFFALVGGTIYRLAATRLPKHAAMLTGAACIAFVPYGIPGLSYNTLGAGLLTLALATLARALLVPAARRPFFSDAFYLGGVALGGAAFAYPTLVFVTPVVAAAVVVLAQGQRLSAFLRVVAGGFSFALVVSPILLLPGPTQLREVFAYSLSGVSASSSRFAQLWREFQRQQSELVTAWGAVAVFVGLSRISPKLVLPVLPFVPLLARGNTMSDPLASMAYVNSFALLGPLFALALRDTRTASVLMLGAWLPSAVAGMLTGCSSGNGSIVAAIGLFPAAIISGVLLSLWVDQIACTFRAGWPGELFGYSPLVLLCLLLQLLVRNDAVYRDGSLAQLTAQVMDGPYRGLLTTPERERMLARRSADIRAHARTSRALYYYDFPAGYLIATQRPLVASAWAFPFEPRVSIDARFFERKATRGDLIFRLDRDPSAPGDPLDASVQRRGAEVVHRDHYRMWIVR